MDQYKISQTPGGKRPVKKKGSRPPKRKFKRTLDPQMIMAVAASVLALIFVGVAVAHFAGKRDDPTVTGSSGATTKKGTGSGSTGIVPGEAFGAVTEGIGNKQPGALNKYYAKTVHVVIPKRKVNQNVAGKSVEALISDLLNGATNPWNWHVPASDLAAWQNGPNGQYFTGNVIVGISQDGTVISVGFNSNGEITTVFIAPVGDLTTPTSGTGSGGTGTGPGGSSTSPTSPDSTPVTNQNDSD